MFWSVEMVPAQSRLWCCVGQVADHPSAVLQQVGAQSFDQNKKQVPGKFLKCRAASIAKYSRFKSVKYQANICETL